MNKKKLKLFILVIVGLVLCIFTWGKCMMSSETPSWLGGERTFYFGDYGISNVEAFNWYGSRERQTIPNFVATAVEIIPTEVKRRNPFTTINDMPKLIGRPANGNDLYFTPADYKSVRTFGNGCVIELEFNDKIDGSGNSIPVKLEIRRGNHTHSGNKYEYNISIQVGDMSYSTTKEW